MSRIGKLPVNIPAGVTISIDNGVVTVKGPKGELKQEINPNITVEIEGNVCNVTRPNDEKENRAMHGLYRSLINNMVIGVSEGYKKTLELVGVGYRASNNGQVLELSLGYTHAIYLGLAPEIKVQTVSERNQIHLSYSKAVTNNFSVKYVLRFVRSVNQNLIKVKVLNSKAKLFVVKLVKPLVNNLRKFLKYYDRKIRKKTQDKSAYPSQSIGYCRKTTFDCIPQQRANLCSSYRRRCRQNSCFCKFT